MGFDTGEVSGASHIEIGITLFWHERSALQSVAVRLSTGNDISGNNFHRYFFSVFFLFSVVTFSPRRSA